MRRKYIAYCVIIVSLTILALASCAPAATGTTPEKTAAHQTASAVAPTPTLTPEPAAARVNGEIIPLADYEAELARLAAAEESLNVTSTPEEQSKQVLDAMIDQSLLAQAAFENGFKFDETALDERIARLEAELGGEDALITWQNEYGYTPQSFRRSLAQAVAADWQREKIAADTPDTAEQVHAEQIFLLDPDEANAVKNRLNSGAEFATVAEEYDPVTKGDLGWFPRGYLYLPEVETAAFALEPGQVSEVIKSEIGYHIVRVIERDPQRVLDSDAYLAIKRQAISIWLAEQRSKSQIEILAP